MNKTKAIYLYLFFLIATFSTEAATVKGLVIDSKNKTIPGVSIYIKSIQKGAVTIMDGSYSLSGLSGGSYSIRFSFVGFQSEEHTVILENKTVLDLNVQLKEETNSLDEIVVSAGRVPERLSSIPASVTLIKSGDLDELGKSTSNMNEMLELKVPGMASQSGSFSNWGQTLRGRKILTMIDGVPLSTPLRNGQVDMKTVNANDLERVEVLKGASSIYGNGGDGGYINYITKMPEKGKKISGTTDLWGTLNLAKSKESLGGGLYQSLSGTSGKIGYVGSFSYEKTGNKYDAHGVPVLPTYGLDNTKIISTFGKINYQLSDKQQLSLSANYYKSKQETPFEPVLSTLTVLNAAGDYVLTPGYGKPKSANYPESPTGASSFNTVLKYNLDKLFGGTTSFSADAYYQKSRNIFFYSTSFQNGGQSVINSEKIGVRPGFNTVLKLSETSFSFIYGVDALKDKTNQALLDGRMWIPDIKLQSVAPYFQTNIKIDNLFNIKAGVRYDDMRLHINDYSTLPYSAKQDGNFTSAVAVKGGKMQFDNLAFNIGLRYVESEKFIPYVNYSQSFSLPDMGSILRSTDNPNIVSSVDVEAAVTNNYEVGFLVYLKNIKIEAVGYYSSSNIGTGLTFNDAKNRFEPSLTPQKIFGGEFSVDGKFCNNKLLLGSSFSWVEGLKYVGTNKNSFVYVAGDVIASPKLTGYASYRFTSKLSSNVSVVYTGDRNRFAPILNKNNVWVYNSGEAPVKGYAVVNMSVSYDLLSNLGISLAVNNLLNNYYLPARSQWAAPLGSQTSVAEGANARLSLKYSF